MKVFGLFWFCSTLILLILLINLKISSIQFGVILMFPPFPSSYVVVVQLPSRVQLFVTPWSAGYQVSLSLTISQSFPKFMIIAPWCCPAILSFDVLFSFWLQSFPASGTFPMSHLFASDDQNTLQGIFPTQESNRGLLHCRPIVYQLSYQESPPSHTAFNKRITTRNNLGVIFLISLQRQKCHCSTKKRPKPNPDWRRLLPFMP